MTVEVRITAGIAALNLPGLVSSAKRRIILHAGLYAPFADSEEFETAFRTALSGSHFQRLDAIAFNFKKSREWGGDFASAVRFGVSESRFAAECETSDRFIRTLEGEFPDKVRVHSLRKFPCLPVVAADDAVVCGQYARCSVHAPEGFWMRIDADVEYLLERARNGGLPEDASEYERAAFRLVSECVDAMNEKG